MTLPDRRLITELDSFGYQVRFMRRLVRYNKYFSFNQYGGRGKALSAAIAWRDETLRDIKASGKRAVNTPRNTTTTGITGVSRRIKSNHGRPKRYLCYTVFWVNNGKSSVRSFQVGNLDTISADDELHAFRTARLFRYLYELSIDEGMTFDPLVFRGWKKKRLYDEIEVAS